MNSYVCNGDVLRTALILMGIYVLMILLCMYGRFFVLLYNVDMP